MKVIPITEAKRLFPDFQPRWRPHHPECRDPGSVVLGNPKFCTVRHVVVVVADESGKPTKALYDKMQVEEGASDQTFPGTIVIPWFRKDGRTFIVLLRKERPVRGTNSLEFPQGYAESMETTLETGVRELLEETGLSPISPGGLIKRLQDVCPEPDWFPRAPAIVAVEVEKGFGETYYPVDDLSFVSEIDSGTSLGALMRFLAWLQQR